MSFVLTVFVREVILMAAEDVAGSNRPNETTSQPSTVSPADCLRRIFLAPNGVGISFGSPSMILSSSVASHVQTFINQHLAGRNLQVNDVPPLLFEYFQELGVTSKIVFHVAGYKVQNGDNDQQVWFIDTEKGLTQRLNAEGIHGAAWASPEDPPINQAADQVSFSKILVIKPDDTTWIAEEHA